MSEFFTGVITGILNGVFLYAIVWILTPMFTRRMIDEMEKIADENEAADASE